MKLGIQGFLTLLLVGVLSSCNVTSDSTSNDNAVRPVPDLTAFTRVLAVGDQCNTTSQCKSIYGNTATDCADSKSSSSVCMCGNGRCDASTTPGPTPEPEPEPEDPPFTPVPPIGDECNKTSECQAIYGSAANDCANSRANNSICMCEGVECYKIDPVAGNPTVPTDPVDPPTSGNGTCNVVGELNKFQRVELLCEGKNGNENDDATFTNNRFNVTFKKGSQTFVVPGHFAADGNAANSGATSGNKWRAYFMPPTTGTWTYTVSFRTGSNIVISSSATAGSADSALDGKTGTFSVGSVTASKPDMRARGLLRHVDGERYLRFSHDDTVFIEGGMDSPENIFGYSDFDNTSKHSNVGSCKGILHDFSQHTNDWKQGDPTWKNGKGKALIGLLNYISGHGVNAVYVMANTVNGDGCDAHPWADYNQNGTQKAFDVSKLDQWEIAFRQMERNGLLIHLMTQETENDQLLNNGNLGLERKLYYRELISRFGHHPALQWNLGEENTNTVAQQKSYADFIKNLDPYDHPVFMHTFPGEHDKYDALLGHATFDGPTFQYGNIPNSATNSSNVYEKAKTWIQKSTAAGNSWVVTFTEASGSNAPQPYSQVDKTQRVYWMWASAMSGGGGFEWYLKNSGSGHAYDLAVEDLREFDQYWEQSGYFVSFFEDIVQGDLNIDLQDLSIQNNLTSTGSDWVLAEPGHAYLIFLRDGGTSNINLPDNKVYEVLWFNPRTGQKHQSDAIQGPGNRPIGYAPNQTNQDWAVVVYPQNTSGN